MKWSRWQHWNPEKGPYTRSPEEEAEVFPPWATGAASSSEPVAEPPAEANLVLPKTKKELDQEFEEDTFKAIQESQAQTQTQVYWDKIGRWEEWGGHWWKLSSSGWWEKWKME